MNVQRFPSALFALPAQQELVFTAADGGRRRLGGRKLRTGPDYLAKRARNNEAVRRSRERSKKHEFEREKLLEQLQKGSQLHIVFPHVAWSQPSITCTTRMPLVCRP